MADLGKASLWLRKMIVILLRSTNCERSKGTNSKYYQRARKLKKCNP